MEKAMVDMRRCVPLFELLRDGWEGNVKLEEPKEIDDIKDALLLWSTSVGDLGNRGKPSRKR